LVLGFWLELKVWAFGLDQKSRQKTWLIKSLVCNKNQGQAFACI
jgi:hypothetical protein